MLPGFNQKKQRKVNRVSIFFPREVGLNGFSEAEPAYFKQNPGPPYEKIIKNKTIEELKKTNNLFLSLFMDLTLLLGILVSSVL